LALTRIAAMLWIGAILAHVDFLDEQIDRLSDRMMRVEVPLERFVQCGDLWKCAAGATLPFRGLLVVWG